MLEDCATAPITPSKGFPADIPGCCEAALGAELPTALRARHAFDGLIADRGKRRPHASSQPARTTKARALAVVPESNAQEMRVGVAESSEQIKAMNLIRERYAWRGYSLEASEYQSAAIERTALRAAR